MTATQCVWMISKYCRVPDDGVTGSRGYWLLEAMAQRGVECVLVTSTNPFDKRSRSPRSVTRYPSGGSLRVVRLDSLRYARSRSLRRALSWIQFEMKVLTWPKCGVPRPDVIIASSPSLLTVITGLLLGRRFPCRVVFEVRDIWPLTLTEEGGLTEGNLAIRLLRIIEMIGYKHCDAIVGTMPNLIRHVEKSGIRNANVHCVPMGVDPGLEAYRDEAWAGQAAQLMPSAGFVVTYAGTVGTTNCLAGLLDTADALKSDERFHFLIMGDGDLKEALLDRSSSLPNVTFLARQPRLLAQAILRRSDLLYFATYDSEVWEYGQSLNKLTDYMMAGRPIVGSYSGFPSMIDEAECGSFVPAQDTEALRTEIIRYADMDAQAREELGLRAREWIRENRQYVDLASEYLAVLN